MITLATFKKEIIVGAKFHTVFHKAIIGRTEDLKAIYGDEDKGVREVSIKQTNSFALKTTKKDGTVVDSWCQYPKATECTFNGRGSVTIHEKDRDGHSYPVLTYTKVN